MSVPADLLPFNADFAAAAVFEAGRTHHRYQPDSKLHYPDLSCPSFLRPLPRALGTKVGLYTGSEWSLSPRLSTKLSLPSIVDSCSD